MKYLTVARHGDYNSERRLNELGKAQMWTLASCIKDLTENSSCHVISSTAFRALDSAEILRQVFDLTSFGHYDFLWSGGDSPCDAYDNIGPKLKRLERLNEIIEEEGKKADSLVVVTHKEVMDEFPFYFFREKLGGKGLVPLRKKGQGIFFDLAEKKYIPVPDGI